MKRAPINQDRFEAIEAYVLDTMPAVRRGQFEQELAGDPDLREELDMQRDHIMAVEMAGMEQMLKHLAAEERGKAQTSTGGRGMGWLKYAAVLALLATGALWWTTRPSQAEQLFAEYHVPDPGLPVPMSTVGDPVFQDAMVAYKLGNLEEAIGKWSNLLQQKPANDTLLYYIGQAQLQLGRTSLAINNLRMVTRDSTSNFREKARWYLFLAHLKLNEREAMQAMDMGQDSIYGERARAIGARLDR